MIPEQVQKKMMIILAILALIGGIIFIIFAIFINKGKLIVDAKAPYLVNIDNFKTVSCINDQCEITLAPKRYTISISKEGYEKVIKETEIPLGGEKIEKIDFMYIPSITEVKNWNYLNFSIQAKKFEKEIQEISLNSSINEELKVEYKAAIKNIFFHPQGESAVIDNGKEVVLLSLQGDQNTSPFLNLNIPSNTKVFFDPSGKNLFFIETDKATFKQTLYQLNLNQQQKKTLITTFIRPISEYFLVFSSDLKKIALVDQTKAEENNVYILDLEKKTRNKIFDAPLITYLKWLNSASENLLVETRKNGSFEGKIWTWDSQNKALQPLSINTTLSNVTVKDLDADSSILLVAEKNELLSDTSNTIESMENNINNRFSFIEYDWKSNEKKLLKRIENIPYPEKIELKGENGGITKMTELLFLSGNKVYLFKY